EAVVALAGVEEQAGVAGLKRERQFEVLERLAVLALGEQVDAVVVEDLHALAGRRGDAARQRETQPTQLMHPTAHGPAPCARTIRRRGRKGKRKLPLL